MKRSNNATSRRSHGIRHGSANGIGWAASVVLVLVVFLSVLLILGGGAFYWLRATNMRRMVVMEQKRAMVAHFRARQARLEAEIAVNADRMAPASAEAPPAEIDMAELAELVNPDLYRTTIKLDNNGNIEVNGNRVRLDELYGVLSRDDRPYELSVVVKVEAACPFKHVAGVLSLCEQIGIADVQVAAATSD